MPQYRVKTILPQGTNTTTYASLGMTLGDFVMHHFKVVVPLPVNAKTKTLVDYDITTFDAFKYYSRSPEIRAAACLTIGPTQLLSDLPCFDGFDALVLVLTPR